MLAERHGSVSRASASTCSRWSTGDGRSDGVGQAVFVASPVAQGSGVVRQPADVGTEHQWWRGEGLESAGFVMSHVSALSYLIAAERAEMLGVRPVC